MSLILNAPEVNKALRTMRWHAVEHTFHADVFIDIRPVHTLPVPDKLKVCPLPWCRFRQPPGPDERYTDDAAVHQIRNNGVGCNLNVPNPRLRASHSAHAMPP
jgi:hypothetical protein